MRVTTRVSPSSRNKLKKEGRATTFIDGVVRMIGRLYDYAKEFCGMSDVLDGTPARNVAKVHKNKKSHAA